MVCATQRAARKVREMLIHAKSKILAWFHGFMNPWSHGSTHHMSDKRNIHQHIQKTLRPGNKKQKPSAKFAGKETEARLEIVGMLMIGNQKNNGWYLKPGVNVSLLRSKIIGCFFHKRKKKVRRKTMNKIVVLQDTHPEIASIKM